MSIPRNPSRYIANSFGWKLGDTAQQSAHSLSPTSHASHVWIVGQWHGANYPALLRPRLPTYRKMAGRGLKEMPIWKPQSFLPSLGCYMLFLFDTLSSPFGDFFGWLNRWPTLHSKPFPHNLQFSCWFPIPKTMKTGKTVEFSFFLCGGTVHWPSPAPEALSLALRQAAPEHCAGEPTRYATIWWTGSVDK